MTYEEENQLNRLIEDMEFIHGYDHDREDCVNLYASDGGACLSFDSSDIRLLKKLLRTSE